MPEDGSPALDHPAATINLNHGQDTRANRTRHTTSSSTQHTRKKGSAAIAIVKRAGHVCSLLVYEPDLVDVYNSLVREPERVAGASSSIARAAAYWRAAAATPFQHEGGAAETNPFVLPAHGSNATASNIASTFRRTIIFPECAAAAGVRALNSTSAQAEFISIFPLGNAAFTHGKDKQRPTGQIIMRDSGA